MITPKGQIVLMGGMGFPATETPWGMFRLHDRLQAIGLAVLLVSWKDRQRVRDFMAPYAGWRAYAGDSLGAGSAAQYPADVSGTVDYVAGFQPSNYDMRSKKHLVMVSANVVRAHCVYDPVWIESFGLGQSKYVVAPGAKTVLLTTEHRGAHPDDWGFAQDLIFSEIRGLIEGLGK